MAPVPDLELRRTHLLITRTLLTLYDLDLTSDSQTDESIRVQGHAGLSEEKSIDSNVTFSAMPIGQWLPAQWKSRFKGSALGDIHYTGKIQSWKLHQAKVPCGFKTGELTMFHF